MIMTTCNSVSDYVNLAKKMISKFSPKFYNGLKREMLNSEDAISNVASAIMLGDHRYDAKRTGDTGQSKTQYSYRNQCAIWAIKTYITTKYGNKNKPKVFSLDYVVQQNTKGNDNECCLHDTIADHKQGDPFMEASNKEQAESLKKDLYAILDSGVVSETQKKQIKMYYIDDMSLNEIGKKFDVSREAVRLSIKKGLRHIRGLIPELAQ